MGPNKVLAGQLVESLREALGQTPAVGEDDRAPVRPDELEDAGMDRRPDARPGFRQGRRAARLLIERDRFTEPAHVLDRDDDLELERLPGPRVDDRQRSIGTDADPEAGDR